MNEEPTGPLVIPLNDPHADLALVGGKGASLARLAAHGLPVPPGFHLTTLAYGRFVAAAGLQEAILAATAEVCSDRPETHQEAASRIARLFAHAPMPPWAAEAIRSAYAALGGGDRPVAVRSSGTAEDLPGLSFAGQHETFLNVQGEAMLLDAVKRCWASLWTARAIGYRTRHGIDPRSVRIAVVVQDLVPADAAGVLFTTDPVTLVSGQIHINAAWGLGEAVVSGEVTPDTFVVDRAAWVVIRQQIGDKAVMTMRTADGTRTVEVPVERRRAPVLDRAEAVNLAQLGAQIEKLYAQPMDIEWARAQGRFYILQARPITGRDKVPASETWNDSLAGDYLWTSANLGEAIPDVMTPCTWSLVGKFMEHAMFAPSIAGHRVYGNIGGRFYMSLSMLATLAAAFGRKGKLNAATEQVFGRLPAGLECPTFPVSRWRLCRELLPMVFAMTRRTRACIKRLSAFLAEAPARCDALHAQIGGVHRARDLVPLWRDDIEPFFRQACHMQQAAGRQDSGALVHMFQELRECMGEADANTLTTGLHTSVGELASLGPLIGLGRLAQGEIDQATYARRYGHRSPHEFEVSMPRPAEDPLWIERQLAHLKGAAVDPTALLARQEAARAEAWRRLGDRYPKKVKEFRRKVERWAAVARDREATRSEVIRGFWVLRAFVLRAGVLTGRGTDLFFLTIEEILALLGGDEAALPRVPIRRATYERYRALPTYPTLILGRFDPFAWAADPDRRGDLFDARGARSAPSQTITGFPGAAGTVEGAVRVIARPEEGDALQPGEILVTTVTNVGWTPLFPRAGAIVTDVGAPLSHAAIVSRELGIPAVVGCGNATMLLHSGDWVRVDGRQGTVELIRRRA